MTKLVWGDPGSKKYKTGLDRGTLVADGQDPVAWNGLVSLTENVSGGEVESYYYDGNKYMDCILYEDYQATLEAFDAPREFGPCDGSKEVALGFFVSAQPRAPFHLHYRNMIGDDLGEDTDYEIHIAYNCMAAPAEKSRRTKSDDTSLPTLSWTIYGRPPAAGAYAGVTYKPTAHITLLASAIPSGRIVQIEEALYGTVSDDAWMPTQQNFLTFINTGSWT